MTTKAIAVALIVVGLILLYFGFQTSDSLAGNIEEAVTGSPPDKAVWQIVGGAFALVAGAVMLFLKPKS